MDDLGPKTGGPARRDFMATMAALPAWLAAAAQVCQRCRPAARGGRTCSDVDRGATDDAAPLRRKRGRIDASTSNSPCSHDAPGAHEAGVLYFIDRSMTTLTKDQAPLFADGTKTLAASVSKAHGAGATFSLSPADQDAELASIEQTPFFGAMRFATIAGFLALPKYGGNRDFVGWTFMGQGTVMEYKPPFGWYDRPENQQALLGRVL